MYKLNNWIILLVLLVLMCACNGAGKMLQFTSDDNGKAVEIEAGETFQVALSSNPTTGYQWEVEQFDPTILQQVGEAVYDADNKSDNLVGGGGTETFTFEALASGQTDLKLIYHRQWEKDIPPIETFMISITVK